MTGADADGGSRAIRPTDVRESDLGVQFTAFIDEHRQHLLGSLATVLTGHRAGPMPLRWVLLHVLRELAQHCGHADILREQILAERGRRGVWAGVAR